MFKKVCFLGLGYIGMPTAAVAASSGIEVVGVDVNQKVIDALNNGKIIIEEPGLEELIGKVVANKQLRGSLVPEEADAYIICVPTPFHEDKTADMKYVVAAAESIVPFLKKGALVVLESTSPPRTTLDILCPILEKSNLTIGTDIFVAYSPERVFPGKALSELIENNRVVGGINEESTKLAQSFYKVFVRGEVEGTNSTTAETCKLMENTFRDVNIALANELAKICDDMCVNVWDVIRLSNSHPRVNFLQPGPGVGGHCIAIDPWFVVEKNPEKAKIIRLARETNDSMPSFVFDKIKGYLNGSFAQKKVVIFGITFKPDVDDIRESPILHLADMLQKEGVEVVLHDPHAKEHPLLERDSIKAVKDADLIVLGVNHQEFKSLDFKVFAPHVRNAIVFDTRNSLDRVNVENAGFGYHLLGYREDV